jgi:Sulfotransferase family
MSIHSNQLQICSHPVFIIGSPRSGTSVLGWALHQHSHLWTSHESDLLFNLYGGGHVGNALHHVDEAFYRAKSRPGTWLQEHDVERAEFLEYLGLGLNALFTNRSQGKRWVDNTPVNTLIVDVLVEMFPSAFFLHILRDSRRVLHSMMNFRNMLGDESELVESGFLPRFATDFREGCKCWCLYVDRSMDFCARHPTRCLTVTNEELVADPHKGFSKICGFIRVPYEDGPANFFRSNRINSSFPNALEKVSGLNSSDPWKQWTPEQKQIFFGEVGPTLVRYGLVTEDGLKSYID